MTKPASISRSTISRLADRLPVEALDREPLRAAAFTCATSAASAARSHSSSGSRSGTSERPPRSTKRAGSPPSRTTYAPATRAARPSARFGHGKAAPYGWAGIGRGEHERLGLLAVLRSQLAQPLDCPAERELRAAQAFDEVAAPAEAERLERLQLAVDRAVAARDPLAAHPVARDDALALEQQLRERAPVGLAREQPRRLRPAALGRGHLAGAAAGEAARARPLRLGLETTTCAERRPGIVCDLARPDEIPQRGQRLLGFEPGVEQQVVPEERTTAERSTQPLVDLLSGRSAAGGGPSAGASSRK